MNYYLYQNNQFIKAFPTQEAGMKGIEELFNSWKLNAPRVPPLKLCYNGFKSVTLAEIGGS